MCNNLANIYGHGAKMEDLVSAKKKCDLIPKHFGELQLEEMLSRKVEFNLLRQ